MKIYMKYTLAILALLAVTALLFFTFFDEKVVGAVEEKLIIQEAVGDKQPIQQIDQDRVEDENIDEEEITKEVAMQDQNQTAKPLQVQEIIEKPTQTKKPIPHVQKLEPVYNFEIEELIYSAVQATSEPEPKINDPMPQEKKEPQEAVLVQKGLIQPREVNQIDEKIKIFNQRPHYDRAYTIAYDYFMNEEYEKSIEWLKKADSLEGAQEKVFELYAKALYKLGKDKQAVNILHYYLQLKASSRLEALKRLIEENSL